MNRWIGSFFGLGFLFFWILMVQGACDLLTPTPPDTTVIVTNTASTGGGSGSGSGSESESPATVSVFGLNNEGKTLYLIGPGNSIQYAGGSAGIVWCRPGSSCNGEGTNRTDENVKSPPVNWIDKDQKATFRRAGSTGTISIFDVDGHIVRHIY